MAYNLSITSRPSPREYEIPLYDKNFIREKAQFKLTLLLGAWPLTYHFLSKSSKNMILNYTISFGISLLFANLIISATSPKSKYLIKDGEKII